MGFRRPYLVEFLVPWLIGDEVVHIGADLFFQSTIIGVDNASNIVECILIEFVAEDVKISILEEISQFRRWFLVLVISFSVID